MKCVMCGGAGVIEFADVYRNLRDGRSAVDWESARTVRCGCTYKEAA
jgi:hypothetical protein